MNEPLNRDQLISALDTEINHVQTSSSWNGHTRWGLIVTLSGLLWLGLQIPRVDGFSWNDVGLLTLALLICWEFIVDLWGSVDSPIRSNRHDSGKYYSFNHLLGAVRSTILFGTIKAAALLLVGVLLWHKLSLILLICLGAGAFAAVCAFGFSFWEPPPVSISEVVQSDSQIPKVYRIQYWLIWIFRTWATASLSRAVYHFRADFVSDEFRMAVILAAVIYLFSILIDQRIPATHLEALRTVRQNLAFQRLSLEDAQREVDILMFVGGTAASRMQDSPDALLALAEQVRSAYADVQQLHATYQEQLKKVERTSGANLFEQSMTKELQEIRKDILRKHSLVKSQHDKLISRFYKLQRHIRVMGLFSMHSANELIIVIEKLKHVLDSLNEVKTRINRLISDRNV